MREFEPTRARIFVNQQSVCEPFGRHRGVDLGERRIEPRRQR
jgi:hypothetical protein